MDSSDRFLAALVICIASLVLAGIICTMLHYTIIGTTAINAGLQQGAIPGQNTPAWVERTK